MSGVSVGDKISAGKIKILKSIDDFEQFDTDEVPSNSDLTFIISQYMQAMEKYRSDNIYLDLGSWYYRTEGSGDKIRTAPPAKLKK